MKTDNQTQRFWSAFRDHAGEIRLLALSGQLAEAHLRIWQLLQQEAIPFPVELTINKEGVALIFPPGWCYLEASQIDTFLTFAPAIPGWTFYGRRQGDGWGAAFARFEAAFGVDARDARFNSEQSDDGLFITMYSQIYSPTVYISDDTLVYFLLSHSIGDEVMLSRFGGASIAMPEPAITTLGPSGLSQLILNCPPLIDWQ